LLEKGQGAVRHHALIVLENRLGQGGKAGKAKRQDLMPGK